jgi:hypothetical protein
MRWRGKKRVRFDESYEVLRVCNRTGRPGSGGPGVGFGPGFVGRNGGVLNSSSACRRDRARAIVISKFTSRCSALGDVDQRTSKSLRFAPPISPSGQLKEPVFDNFKSGGGGTDARPIAHDIYGDVVSPRSFEVREDAMEARFPREFYPSLLKELAPERLF